MTRVGLLDGVNRERADGVNAQLIDVYDGDRNICHTSPPRMRYLTQPTDNRCIGIEKPLGYARSKTPLQPLTIQPCPS